MNHTGSRSQGQHNSSSIVLKNNTYLSKFLLCKKKRFEIPCKLIRLYLSALFYTNLEAKPQLLGAWLLFLKLKRWYDTRNIVWQLDDGKEVTGLRQTSVFSSSKVSNILIGLKFFNCKYVGGFKEC